MSRAEIERRVVEYLDAHDAEAVDLLQRLVRVRSLARQEGRPDQPGTVNHLLAGELHLAVRRPEIPGRGRGGRRSRCAGPR